VKTVVVSVIIVMKEVGVTFLIYVIILTAGGNLLNAFHRKLAEKTARIKINIQIHSKALIGDWMVNESPTKQKTVHKRNYHVGNMALIIKARQRLLACGSKLFHWCFGFV